MEGTVFTPSLEGMNHVKSPEGEMLAKQFLDVCRLILPDAQLRRHIDATLGSGNLREAVRLPIGEDINEWLAINTVDFFNQVNLLYGTLTEFCTQASCPNMSAGPKYEYRWADGVKVRKPIEVSAPEYVEYLMEWTETQIDDENIFPQKLGTPFPPNFKDVVKTILKRLFRVYAHIYHSHFQKIVCLKEEAHLNKFGASMALVKSDIGGNITRLESKYSSDPSKFEYLYNMVQVEVETKTAKSSSSCTNGLLWLTRAMDFLVELFRNLLEHPDWTMPQACTESYTKTLKKWHGWLASSSFTVAMKLAPDRKKFMDVIGGSGDVNVDMEKFCTTFSPLLQENHKFLASVGLDDLKAS